MKSEATGEYNMDIVHYLIFGFVVSAIVVFKFTPESESGMAPLFVLSFTLWPIFAAAMAVLYIFEGIFRIVNRVRFRY